MGLAKRLAILPLLAFAVMGQAIALPSDVPAREDGEGPFSD